MSVQVKKDTTKSLIKSIKSLSNDRVFVGIPKEKGARKTAGINNATLAFIHSNGSPANNIPARPFLIPGVKKAENKNLEILKKAADLALDNKNAASKGLNAVGLNTQSVVKSYIKNSDNFQPLSEKTISQRQSKGFKGTKPLIRTAQLLNSISYVIRRK